jgi:outer membrane lipoprotein-sorting protein
MKMKSIQRGVFLFVIVLLVAASAVAGTDVRSMVRNATSRFKDVSMTCRVIRADREELRKIGKDFQNSYDIKTSKVEFKAPDKMKMEGKVGFVDVIILINGDRKAYLVPSMHIAKRENIKGKPHQRQTELDLGILTGSLWHDYIVSSAVPSGMSYKIVYARSNAPHKKIILWADRQTLKLQKMDKFSDDGRLKARYVYSDHKKIGGIWVPTKIDVYNEDGKLSAETGYDNIKVNSGLSDSIFNQ